MRGTNLIWCASFQLAWKEVAKALAHEAPLVNGAESFCNRLNAASDPRQFLAADTFYAIGGGMDAINRIRSELPGRFPAAQLPGFGVVSPDSVIAYAYLQADVPFALPFFDNDRAVEFREASGGAVKVKTFGISAKDDYAYHRLRAQVRVLFGKDSHEPDAEFAVDPDQHSSSDHRGSC
ncbi:MAG: hypothetical protein AB1705_23725 [Verrucomicrobiota bacterium]